MRFLVFDFGVYLPPMSLQAPYQLSATYSPLLYGPYKLSGTDIDAPYLAPGTSIGRSYMVPTKYPVST
eukprot:1710407-Rhodomonas_salina.1